MPRPSCHFPDLHTLTVGLNSVFGYTGSGAAPITVLDREPNPNESTFPSEIVYCRLVDGRRQRLFCKCAARENNRNHGHRGGVEYEAEVYQQVVQPLRMSTPTFYGLFADRATGRKWLVLEYLDKAYDVSQAPQRNAMGLAARWLGRFHTNSAARMGTISMSFLRIHAGDHYQAWARRASRSAGRWRRRLPWLALSCRHFETCAAALSAAPQTVIHGEYYPENVLFRSGTVFPVDWEGAARAGGEFDLAMLTEEWPQEVVRQCEREYQRARWPEGAPPDFEKTLGAARLALLVRWLGEHPNWAACDGSRSYFEQLRCAGERFGLI